MAKELSCIVVEDEQPAIQLLEKYIGQTPGLKWLHSFRQPLEAMKFMENNTPDVIFCDIQMPGISGLDLAKAIGRKCMVIFTTAYSEFAAEAFDIDAIDYLKKPFSYERFMKAVQKAQENAPLRHAHAKQAPGKTEVQESFIVIKAEHKLIRVHFDNIVLLEAFHEYVKIITTDSRIITFERLKNMEAILPASIFLRVHRSYIVNRSKVSSISGNMLDVEGHQVPVSREMKNRVIKALF